jgi:hypothetical protein
MDCFKSPTTNRLPPRVLELVDQDFGCPVANRLGDFRGFPFCSLQQSQREALQIGEAQSPHLHMFGSGAPQHIQTQSCQEQSNERGGLFDVLADLLDGAQLGDTFAFLQILVQPLLQYLGQAVMLDIVFLVSGIAVRRKKGTLEKDPDKRFHIIGLDDVFQVPPPFLHGLVELVPAGSRQLQVLGVIEERGQQTANGITAVAENLMAEAEQL